MLRGPLDDYMPPKCELVIVSFEPNNPPFGHGGMDEACVDAWERHIQHLLGELTGPMIKNADLLQPTQAAWAGA